MFILMALLGGTHVALLKQMTPAAAFKWAKMNAAGKKVDLMHEPPEVKAHRNNPNFSDEETSPSSRVKKAKAGPTMLVPPTPQEIIGAAPASAAELSSVYAPGVAVGIPLPALEPGDADVKKWHEATAQVCHTGKLQLTHFHEVPVASLAALYNTLSAMAAVETYNEEEGELTWCSIPVRFF